MENCTNYMENCTNSMEDCTNSMENCTNSMENLGAFDPALYTRRMTTGQKASTAYITERLQSGAKPRELIKEGYARSSVYSIVRKLKVVPGKEAAGEAEAWRDAPAVSEPRPTRKARTTPPSNSTGTRARITQEEIIIPGHLFLWYDLVREAHPDYTATKTEWLEDVVETWATDYGEPMRREFLRSMGVDPMTMKFEGDEDFDTAETDTVDGSDSASSGDEPREPDDDIDGSPDGADEA